MSHYEGVRELADISADALNEFESLGATTLTGVELNPNEFVIMRSKGRAKPVIGRHASDGIVKKLNQVNSLLQPRNKEQEWALELLHDDSIKLVTLTGPAGVGKSLLAIAAGKQLLDAKRYSRMLVTRPIVPLGRDLGYLPGTIHEKMEPWIAPIKDNLAFILDVERNKTKGRNKTSSMQYLFDNDVIEIEAVSYIRGRSLPNTYMIVDEAQNLDLASLKTIITRVGEGTKIVLTGDLDQIDIKGPPGLPTVISKFMPETIAGHINLRKGERSELATIASNIL